MVTTQPKETDVAQDANRTAGDNISMDSTSTLGSAANSSWFSSGASAGILPSFVIGGGMGDAANNNSSNGAQQWTPSRALAELRKRMRPWFSEFFKFQKFKWPPGVAAIAPRLKRNLQYFFTNYLCLFVILLVYCILTSILMLIALLVLGGFFYTIYQRTQKGPVVISNCEIPPSLLYTAALVICFPLFAFADVGGVMYWVLGSSLFLIAAHAFFYSSEEVPGAEFEVVTVVA